MPPVHSAAADEDRVHNRSLVGIVAGLAISALGLVYAFIRRDQRVAIFMQPDQVGAGLSARAATWLLFGSMLFMGPFSGALATDGCHPARPIWRWRSAWRR